jgi:IS1 family transposase
MEAVPVMGNQNRDRIRTSIVERQNLTIGMQMGRLKRPTNAFSKQRENLSAAYCPHFADCNFRRIHRSTR